MTEQEKLREAITAHPTMVRLAGLCDKLERVLARKSAGVSEPDGAEQAQEAADRAREAWKARAEKARAHDPHG